MSGLRKVSIDRHAGTTLASSRLTSLLGRLGNQVLWFGRTAGTRVVMISPMGGAGAELLRRCLDADGESDVDVEPTVM